MLINCNLVPVSISFSVFIGLTTSSISKTSRSLFCCRCLRITTYMKMTMGMKIIAMTRKVRVVAFMGKRGLLKETKRDTIVIPMS